MINTYILCLYNNNNNNNKFRFGNCSRVKEEA